MEKGGIIRDIKFRGKKIDSDDWMYGYLREVWGEIQRKFVIAPAKSFECDGYTDTEEDYVKEETIGQFTGLHDKNGKEIYEGDIVRAPLLDPIFGDTIKDKSINASIRYNNGSFVVSYYDGEHNVYIQDLYDEIEVIGNIHDNPGLL